MPEGPPPPDDTYPDYSDDPCYYSTDCDIDFTGTDPPFIGLIQTNIGIPYVPKNTDKLAKPNIILTSTPQAFNTCVMKSIEIVVVNVFKSSKVSTKDIYTKAGINAILNGLNKTEAKALIENFLNTKSFSNFKDAIDSGNIFVTTIPDGGTTGGRHAIVVIGYQDNNNFIYIDPYYGNTRTIDKSNFDITTTFEITTLK